jgi:transposase-like protein
MLLNMKIPKTLQQAIVYFSDPQRAFDYAVKLRWPDGKTVCPRCNSDRNYFIKTRRIWLCRGCNKQFTLKVGTIFEDSALGLDKWMTGFWMLVNCKNGVSSMELHRTLGITQKSAWFMLHRLRAAMKGDLSYKFGGAEGGPVESDETFIGPNPYKMHRSRKLNLQRGRGKGKRYGYVDKTAVFGLLDRDLRQVLAKVVPNVKRETLQNAILDNVEHGSAVYTDCGVGFDNLHLRGC